MQRLISQYTKDRGRPRLAMSENIKTGAKRHLFAVTIQIENAMLSNIDHLLSSQRLVM